MSPYSPTTKMNCGQPLTLRSTRYCRANAWRRRRFGPEVFSIIMDLMKAVRIGALALGILVLFGAPDTPPEPVVSLGRPLAVRLGGGEKRDLRIAAKAGEYLRIEVQADTEMAAKTQLFDPAGKLVAVTPTLGGTGGLARIAAYAETGGDFRLQVESPMFRPDPHTCTVTLTVQRPATAEDRMDAEGHRAFAKAAALANSGAAGMAGAIGALDRPIQLAQQAHDPVLEMRAIYGQGQFRGTLAEQSGKAQDFEKSLPALERCLELCRRFGDRRAEAHVLSSIGQSYGNLERNQDAVAAYQKALELQRAMHQAWETALTLNNLADSEAALGRLDLSLDYLREQESIRQELRDELGLNQMRVSLGADYLALGDFEHALEALAATLPHWRALNDPQDQAEAYVRMGMAYMAAGEFDAAAEALQHAVADSRKLHNSRITADNLVLLAQLAALRHDAAGAESAYARALAEARDAGYRRAEGLALAGLADLEAASGRRETALRSLDEALRIDTDLALPYDEANVRRQIGELRGAGGGDAGLPDLEAALAIERRLGDRFGEVQTLADLARVDGAAGRDQRSLARLTEAMDVIDPTRSSLAEPGLRASYLASQRSVYEEAANLLVRMAARDPAAEDPRRAFEVSERAHARALLDVVGKTADEFDARSDPALRAEARALDSALHAAAMRRQSRRVDDLLARRNQVELRLRQKTADDGAPASARPLGLAAIRRRLLDGRNTVLLEYLTGRQESHLWVVTGAALHHYSLPGEAVLAASAHRLYDALTERNRMPGGLSETAAAKRLAAADRRASAEAAALSRVLLPVPPSLLAGRAMLLVADGPLQLVPFALLPSPGAPGKLLGETNRLTLAPSASVLAQMREASEARAPRLLVLADPVYSASDPRLKKDLTATPDRAATVRSALLRSADDFHGGEFPRLRMSGAEAAAIERLAPAGRVTELLGFDAAPGAFRRPGIDRYSIIHVAAHTLLDNRHPELSGLVLSLVNRQGRPRDGFLRLFDIYEMRLRADLVVLSACETSIGKEMRGEGMIGLARGFLQAGARRILASLWKVDDRATAEFMQRFYTALLREHATPAAALAAAQQAMRRDPAWAAPYYWAPFVLQGEF